MRLTEYYARLIVLLRWLVLPAVGAITWAALTMLPGVESAGGGLASIAGAGGPVIQAQIDVARRFGLPLLTGTAVVQRDLHGLNPQAVESAVLRAVEVDQRTLSTGLQPGRDLYLALPLVNTPLLVPAAAEHNTTVVTYLFTDPTLGLSGQEQVARDYAAHFDRPHDALIGVAGLIPTQAQQRALLESRLPWVEGATLGAIALIVALAFRSVVAPLITLITAAVGYLLADRALGWLAQAAEVTAPVEIQPIVIALMLGIITDYSIFFLSGARRRLQAGQTNPATTREAVREYLPIVLTAGIIVAAGVAALIVANSELFRAFGPGLAVTVVVGLLVAVVLIPAMLAILGRWAFWPYGLSAAPEAGRAILTEAADAEPEALPAPSRLLRLVRHRWVAAVLAMVVVFMLVMASLPLLGMRSAVSPVKSLPADNPVRQATMAAAAGFSPGILSPTGMIISAPGITNSRAALATLAGELQRQPGVDIVLSPADQALASQLLGRPLPDQLGLFLAPDGGAARFLVMFNSDPLGSTAVGHLRAVRDAMPRLLATAGLTNAEVSYIGNTAIGLTLVDQARADIVRVAVAVALVNLLLLILYLRALIAPLYLLASTVLAVGAALGLATLLFQDVLGHDGLIFYVPFAAAVLLVALGSDYTIFSVGYIWDQARHRSLRQALAVAVPRSTRAITVAGVTLAASFALAALIPLSPFYEFAFIMAVGVLIDAFIVRSLLIPALISVVGRASGWPGKRLALPRIALTSYRKSPDTPTCHPSHDT
jgi:RND superfamily putative drug exporter